MILAIDPGTTESGIVALVEDGTLCPQPDNGSWFAKLKNDDILTHLRGHACAHDSVVIEQIRSYGNVTGQTTLDTVHWCGRFHEAAAVNGATVTLIPRVDVKMHLCHNSRASDSNVAQALRDRFGEKGTKAKPGWFYGFAKDVWQAYALGVTFAETKEV